MKASVLFGTGWEDDSLEVLWRDTGRAFCKLRRDDGRGEAHAFIPIAPGSDRSTLDSVNRLMHEHDLQAYLDGPWALRPVELRRERGQTMLVVDYTGGEPLDWFLQQPMEIGQFLRLAVALSSAVGQLHGRGLIHKDLTPAHVLVDPAADRVRLTGFGIASRLWRERQPPDAPELIAGTLASPRPLSAERPPRRVGCVHASSWGTWPSVRVRVADSGHELTRTAPRHHHLRCSKGSSAPCSGAGGSRTLGIFGIRLFSSGSRVSDSTFA